MKLLRATVAALVLGTATVAGAQTSAQAFADQFKTMQSLSTSSTYTYNAAPRFSTAPSAPLVDRAFAETFRQMQASSANSSEWYRTETREYSTIAADPVRKEPFGDMFSRMQAGSSNSDQWKLEPHEHAPAYATRATTTVASATGKWSPEQRTARALRAEGLRASRQN
jgi:hypothetical protein